MYDSDYFIAPPPEDLDCERGLLTTIGLWPEHPEVPEILQMLQPDAFMHPTHRAIYVAFNNLYSSREDINSLTLKSECEVQGTLVQVGGVSGINEVLSGDEVAHPIVLARRIAELWYRRQIMRAASKTLRDAGNPSIPTQELLASLKSVTATHTRSLLLQTNFGKFLADVPPPTNWLIPSVIQRGAPGIFAAQPGAGKSFQCLQLIVSVATGKPFLGHITDLKPRLAIYLSLEDPEEEIHRRLRAVVDLYRACGEWTDQDEANLSRNAILLTPDWGAVGATSYLPRLVPNLDSVIQAMADVDPGVLVIDTFAQAADGDENNAKDVKPLLSAAFSLAQRHNLNVTITHHVAKGQTSARTSEKRTLDELMSTEWIRGSSAILGAARFVLQIVPLRPDQIDKLDFGLDIEKARRGGYCLWGVVKQSIGPRPDWLVLEQVDRGEPGAGCWTVHPRSMDILAALKGARAKADLSKQDELLIELYKAQRAGVEPNQKVLGERFCPTAKDPHGAIRTMIKKLRTSGLLQDKGLTLNVSGISRILEINGNPDGHTEGHNYE